MSPATVSSIQREGVRRRYHLTGCYVHCGSYGHPGGGCIDGADRIGHAIVSHQTGHRVNGSSVYSTVLLVANFKRVHLKNSAIIKGI